MYSVTRRRVSEALDFPNLARIVQLQKVDECREVNQPNCVDGNETYKIIVKKVAL